MNLRRLGRAASLLAIAVTAHCASTLSNGTLGVPRVVGAVRGVPPDVQVLAPIADRSGNVYVLAGTRNLPDVTAFVGRVGGGFSSGCRLNEGDRVGPVGWVGFAQDRAWYWAGNALVQLAQSGDCRRILDRDPTSGADLLVRAVMPWVRDTPSRTTVVAMVATATDPVPFTVQIDLAANIYVQARPFEPGGARDFVLLGSGGSADLRRGFALVSFELGDQTVVEGRFFDASGELLARVRIPDAQNIPPLGIRGFLQANPQGLVAGLTQDKRIVLFDEDGGRVVPAPAMDPIGIHSWDGKLYVVGVANDAPVAAPISDAGVVGEPRTWESSLRITATLSRPLPTTDDRSSPRHAEVFQTPRPVGLFPLVTEHTSPRYADGETLVLVAGPTFGEGAGAFTLLALAPAGVAYP